MATDWTRKIEEALAPVKMSVGAKANLHEHLCELFKTLLEEATAAAPPRRVRLPDTRDGITRHWTLSKPRRVEACPACKHKWEEGGDMKVYATVSTYPDGRPGEVFVRADSVGSTAHGALDAAAIAISIGLQHGIDLSVYTQKLVNTRYGAAGLTGDPEFPTATSVWDLIARWMEKRFVKKP